MRNSDIESVGAAIAALEGQRTTLSDAVIELATTLLQALHAGLLRSSQ